MTLLAFAVAVPPLRAGALDNWQGCRPPPLANVLNAVTGANGLFEVVGVGGALLPSDDARPRLSGSKELSFAPGLEGASGRASRPDSRNQKTT